jgi:hypothetical protein
MDANMVDCEGCRPKGPDWPKYLDYASLAPYQTCCAWCGGAKQVTKEVAAVYLRCKTPVILEIRAISLMGRWVDAKKVWEETQKKRRPKDLSKHEWEATLLKTKKTTETALDDAIEAVWEIQKHGTGYGFFSS